jgi:MFS family permease
MSEPPVDGEATPLAKRGWGRTFESLSYRDFRWLWAGSLTSYAALQMTAVARPWLAYPVSDSAVALGLVAAFQGLPQLLMSPLGGLAADRLPKRVVLHISTFILMTTAVILAALVFFDMIEVWHLVLLSIVNGGTVPFNHPVRQAYIPVLVPRHSLGNAVALNASGRNLNQILGPALAGVLLAIDPFLAFMVIVALHLTTIAVSFGLPLAPPTGNAKRGAGADLIFGLKYVWHNKQLRTLVGLALLAVALGYPYQQLLPVFQKEVLDVGPERLGLMYSALGLGALTASLVVASFAGLSQRGYPQLLAGIAFGVGLVAFALSPIYWLSLPLLFVTGFTSQTYTTMSSTLMMLNAAPELYGRVSSVNMMTRAFMPLVVLPVGALTEVFGAPATIATTGALLAVAIVLVGVVNPALWRGREMNALDATDPNSTGGTKTTGAPR